MVSYETLNLSRGYGESVSVASTSEKYLGLLVWSARYQASSASASAKARIIAHSETRDPWSGSSRRDLLGKRASNLWLLVKSIWRRPSIEVIDKVIGVVSYLGVAARRGTQKNRRSKRNNAYRESCCASSQRFAASPPLLPPAFCRTSTVFFASFLSRLPFSISCLLCHLVRRALQRRMKFRC